MATAKDNLKDFLTCPLCYEEFNGRDPRSLPCLHVFCLSCIQQIHQISLDDLESRLRFNEFKCPTCKTVSQIPRWSVLNFPKFFHANILHDIYQDLSENTKESGRKYKVCWNDSCEIEGYCFTCNKPFCHQCLLGHNKNRRYSDHVHVQVTKDNIKCLICREHDQIVEAYCTDCRKSVCGQCQLTTHSDHDVQDFSIVQSPDLDTLSEIIEKRMIFKQNLQQIEKKQKTFNASILAEKDKLSVHTCILLDRILNQSQTLQDELDNRQADTIRELKKKKEYMRNSEELIGKAEQPLKNMIQPIPEIPELRPKHADKIIAGIKQELPPLPNTMEADIEICQFNPEWSVAIGTISEMDISVKKLPSISVLEQEIKEIIQPIPEIMELHSNDEEDLIRSDSLTSSLDNEEYNNEDRDFSAQQSASINSSENASQALQVTSASSIVSAEIVARIDVPGYVRDVAWLNTGDLIVAVGDDIKMQDRRGKLIDAPFDLSKLAGSIRCFAVHPSQPIVVVAVLNNIYQISVGDRQIPVKICSLRDFCTINMKFTSDGDLLAHSQYHMHKYKLDGRKLWSKKTKHKIISITVLSTNDIIISGEKQLSRYDTNGKWLSSFQLHQQQMLVDPKVICADLRGHLYVADFDKALFMFTSEGEYIKKLCKCDNNPEHMALFQDKYICIAQVSQGVFPPVKSLVVYQLV